MDLGQYLLSSGLESRLRILVTKLGNLKQFVTQFEVNVFLFVLISIYVRWVLF